MPIKITSVQNAPKHFDWATYIITTLTNKKRVQFAGHAKHLRLSFDDTECEGLEEAPQMWHLQRTFQWLEERKCTLEDNLLFHCHAGVSRSTAMAWSTLCWLGVPIEGAFQQVVHSADAHIWPNLLILDHADHVLGLSGELIRFSKEMDEKIHQDRKNRIYGSLQ